jgi:hypothetical protein
MGQAGPETVDVADPVAVGEAARVDLVDDRQTSPGAVDVVHPGLSSFGCQGMT